MHYRSQFAIVLASAAILVAAACTSAPSASDRSDAYSPQRRSYEDQLAGVEGDQADGTRRKKPRRPEAAVGRGRGQGVVDQPIRP